MGGLMLLAPIVMGLLMGFGITVVFLGALKSEREELSRLPLWIEQSISPKRFLISKKTIFGGVIVWCASLALALMLPWNNNGNDALLLVLTGVIGCFVGMLCWRLTKLME
jgi:hypothetical protein